MESKRELTARELEQVSGGLSQQEVTVTEYTFAIGDCFRSWGTGAIYKVVGFNDTSSFYSTDTKTSFRCEYYILTNGSYQYEDHSNMEGMLLINNYEYVGVNFI